MGLCVCPRGRCSPVGDLQLAPAIHVQVGAGQQEDIEAIWRGRERTRGPGAGVRSPTPPCASTRPHLSAHTALRGQEVWLSQTDVAEPDSQTLHRECLVPLPLPSSSGETNLIMLPTQSSQPTPPASAGVVPACKSREGEASDRPACPHLILGRPPPPHLTPIRESQPGLTPYQLDLDQHTACSPIPSPESQVKVRAEPPVNKMVGHLPLVSLGEPCDTLDVADLCHLARHPQGTQPG